MSFPAAAADPSVIGPDDPAADGEAWPPGGEPTDAAVVPGTDPDQPSADPSPAGLAEPSPTTTTPAPASLADDVVAIARTAAVEEAGRAELVGDYLGAVHEDAVAVAAAFAAADRGYRGWYWSVTMALVEPGTPTISEVVLLPGEQALLAPPWVPWDQRIRAGDVGAGDLLPAAPDDIRLVPGYVDSEDPAIKEVEYEFGFGRPRVLSREGRDDAAQRWHDGLFGPDDAIAQAAPANCITCGFFTPLAGLLGATLGACANEYSPADGRVVDVEYGCGAHSQTVINAPLISASTDTVVDELTLEVHRRPARSVVVAPSDAQPSETPMSDAQVSDAQVSDAQVPDAQVGGDDALGTEPDAVLDPVLDAEPDLVQEVLLDPVLGAEPDLLQEVLLDPVLDAEPDVFQDLLLDDQPSDVAWPAPDQPESTP